MRQALFLLLLTVAIIATAELIPFDADATKIEAMFDDELGSEDLLKKWKITSLVVSIVHDNKKLFSKGYGYANPLLKTPVSPKYSQYNIGSITKTFTGTSAMRLVEQGALNLQASVNSFLTTPIVRDQLVGNDLGSSYSGSPVSSTQTLVTLHNLLTHTGGFDEKVLGLSARNFDSKLPLKQYLETNMPPRIRNPSIVSTYSNLGMALTGLLVQEQSKIPFGNYIRDNIFQPLDMMNSFYEFPKDSSNLTANPFYPMPMVRSAADGSSYTKIENFGQYLQAAPTGGIWSTADDMANYALMHLNYGTSPQTGTQILSNATARQMYAQQFNNGDMLGMGYVWLQNRAFDVQYIAHGGVLPPYYSDLSLFHEANAGLFMTMVGTDPTALSILKAKFMSLTMFNATCTGPLQSFVKEAGQCLQTVPLNSIQALPNFDERAKMYEGCYTDFRYEHTTWFKFVTIFTPPYCFVKSGNYLKSIAPVTTLVLFEEKPNQFIIAVESGNGNAVYSLTRYTRATFLVNNITSKADYWVVDQTPFEAANSSIAWNVFLQIMFSVLGLTFCCCCCCCLIFWCVFDVRALVAIYNTRSVNKEARAISTTLSFDDDDQHSNDSVALTHFGNNANTSKEKQYVKTKNRSKALLVAVVVFTVLTIVGILLCTGLNLAHFIITVMQMVLVIPSTDSFLFEQKSRSGLQFSLNLPIFSIMVGCLMVISCICAVIARCLKREALGKAFTVLLCLAVVPVIVVNVLYMIATGYYNIFSSAFLA